MDDVGSNDWKKRYDALKESFEKLQANYEELERRNRILVEEKKRWEIEKTRQMDIIRNAIAQANRTSQEYLEENRRLKHIIFDMRQAAKCQ